MYCLATNLLCSLSGHWVSASLPNGLFFSRWKLDLKQCSLDHISQSLQTVLEVSGLPHSASRRGYVHTLLSSRANYVALVSLLSTPNVPYGEITTPVTGRTSCEKRTSALLSQQ